MNNVEGKGNLRQVAEGKGGRQRWTANGRRQRQKAEAES